VRTSLSASLVEPALGFLGRHGAAVRFRERLRAIRFDGPRVRGLTFGGGEVAIDADDWVVLAVPPTAAAAFVPELDAPPDSRSIVNAHYRLDAPAAGPDGAPFLGLINGTAEWLFFRDDLVSVTVSAADALAERPSTEIASLLWADIARALKLGSAPMPPARIIKERRATFAQTPEAVRRRPQPRTAYRNLLLAGDWTATGLPATIEGAVRSGWAAARLIAGAKKTRQQPALARRPSFG
jgi:hydroxysqualene dehydroxylase